MKIQNKQEHKQVACNHSSDIDLKSFMKKCTVKPYSFLIGDDTLAPNNPLRFR